MAEEKSPGGGPSLETKNVQPKLVSDRPAPVWSNVTPELRPAAPTPPPPKE